MNNRPKLAAALIAALTAAPLHAEEGGTGHYLPGSISSFVDGVPQQPSFVARFNGIHYDGSYSQALPIAGLDPVNVNAESYVAGLTLAWRPDIALPENLSFAMSATVPYLWLDVSADVTAGSRTVRRASRADGLGDIVVIPAMLSYAFTPDLALDFRTSIYAPTGDYEVGRLANTGKNFWTFEPTLGLRYLGQNNGIEASVFTGMDFNTQNDATDYRSGTQFHVDGTLAQHFPLLGGFAGAGVSGYWYQQIAGDSGTGATLGDFKAQTAGVGPAISYTRKAAGADIVGEFKWLHELDTRRRLEGDYLWLKLVLKF